MRHRVLTVIGTRPEVIKMYPVIHALGNYADHIQTTMCTTAQHTGMLQQMLTGFGLIPDYELEPLDPEMSLNERLAQWILGLERVYNIERPDLVLVHGDTLSAAAGALAAFYAGIPVGHVEAGYRTSVPTRPFPEEMDRRLISKIASLHFAPTPAASDNLRREGVEVRYYTGNTVVDATLLVLASPAPPQAQEIFDWADGRQFIVLTVHRRENWTRMVEVVDIVRALAERCPVVWAAHPNPFILDYAYNDWMAPKDRLLVRPAMDYGAFVHVLARADVVITDSGGVVEEAATLGIPMAVLRDETERPEAVDAGLAILTGVQRGKVIDAVSVGLLKDKAPLAAYGDGTAGLQIAGLIFSYLRSTNYLRSTKG